MKNVILLCALALSTIASAQIFTKGTAILKNGQSLQGKLRIDNTANVLLVKNGFNLKSYNFDQVSSAQIAKKNYGLLTVDNTAYLAQQLNDNNVKASLYDLGDNEFLIKVNDMFKSFNLKTDKAVIPGTLSLLFNDCNEIRETIEKEDSFSKQDLLNITNQYNNCSYSAYAPTNKEIKRANTHNTDRASFYVGAGANLNNISFFDQDETEGLVGAGLKLGVIASPSFLGNLQGNLFAFIEGSANFADDKDFSNNADPVNFSVNSFRVQLGLEYLFNKTGNIKPIIGIGFGATSDAFSGSIAGNSFDIDGGNPFIAPRLGARFKLKNEKHIGLMMEYITSYENDLTFPTQDAIIPLEVGSQNIGVSINYYF